MTTGLRRRSLTMAAMLALFGLSEATVADAQTFTGRASAAIVAGVRHCDTGDLPPGGGTKTQTQASIVAGLLTTGPASSDCSGANGIARSSASVQAVAVTQALVNICSASLVTVETESGCLGVQGSAVISGLTFAGVGVTVTGQANQVVSVPGVGTLTINERVATETAITLNALHIVLATGLDIVIGSCHSGFDCPVGVESSTWSRVKGLYHES